jgi:hypothetical protein
MYEKGEYFDDAQPSKPLLGVYFFRQTLSRNFSINLLVNKPFVFIKIYERQPVAIYDKWNIQTSQFVGADYLKL